MTNRMIMAGAALLLAACTESPTETKSVVMQPTRLSMAGLTGTPTGTLDFASDLDGLTTRVVPSLDDAKAAEQLRLELDRLSAALNAGNTADATKSVAAARALLTPTIGAVGDIGVVELVLDNIERALQ